MANLALLGGKKAVDKPFISWPVFDDGDVAAVEGVVRSGKWFRYDGEKNAEFEAAFSSYCGVKRCLTVTNGTAAIEIPLAVLGVGPGDEVIVPSYTFYSTASAVLYVGAKPVFCDVDAESYNMDLDKLDALISPNTKAVIPVHFGGLPVDMDRLNGIAARRGVAVIEDCAHAHGARYKGRMAGSLARAGTFSFQASKNLNSGEGGAILTDDEALYEDMFCRHTCGRKLGRPWYEHHAVASNLRLSEMQAALLISQFARLEAQTRQRLANGALVERALAGCEGIKIVQHREAWAALRAYHLFMLQYDPGMEGVPRELFIRALQAEGVPASGGYLMPLNRQPVFSRTAPPAAQSEPYEALSQPGAEHCCRTTVWIPQNCLLGGAEYGGMVADAVRKVLENGGELRSLAAARP